MGDFIEKQLMNRAQEAAESVVGPQAMRVLSVVNKLASKQGGANVAQNYQLLGKRALITVGVGLVAIQATSTVVGAVVSNKVQKRQIDKAVARALAEERARQNGEVQKAKPTFYKRFGKRACDLAIGLAALPVVGAITTVCGVAIRLEDGGPVFYNAPRVGRGGKEFVMLKLRSMKVDAPDLVMEDGSTYNGADDPRMTRVGAFLRKTSLDEIPQFLNVLKGDMSVVGPRPDLKRETELYRGDEALKLTVKPGVTGYAAVYGRNSLPWHDRLALDVEYVQNLSFPLDVKIFFKTFAAVFSQEGVFVDGAQGACETPVQVGE